MSESQFSVNGLVDQSDEINQTSGKYYLVGGFRYHSMENSNSLLQQEAFGSNLELEAFEN